MDYLDWRGDLTLKQSPFNEVDNLILSELAYLDFDGILPKPGQGPGLLLQTAAEQYFQRFPVKKIEENSKDIHLGLLIPKTIPAMFQKMAASYRFQNMKLGCFINLLNPEYTEDPEQFEQFSALTIETGDHSLYLSFRGTDDTLAGWLENLNMTCLSEVPAQKQAVKYLETIARLYPRKHLRLGGHSKGGNLAVYASVFCRPLVQRRIQAVWSNDGPGFRDELLSNPKHRRIADRIFTIVPKSSVVGMLLEHEEDYTVVDSNQLGFLQHDSFSWQVLGNHFLTLHQVTRQAQLCDLALRGWLQNLTLDQRRDFVESLFHILSASGAETLTDLKEERFKSILAIIRAMKDLSPETRNALFHFAGILFKNSVLLALENLQER